MSADFNPDGPECSNDCECWEWAEWTINTVAAGLDLAATGTPLDSEVYAGYAERLRQAWDIIQIKREVESY